MAYMASLAPESGGAFMSTTGGFMMIRTAVTVLAMVWGIPAFAADPNADQFLAGHPSEPAADAPR